MVEGLELGVSGLGLGCMWCRVESLAESLGLYGGSFRMTGGKASL
jgi:hypothetical protein